MDLEAEASKGSIAETPAETKVGLVSDLANPQSKDGSVGISVPFQSSASESLNSVSFSGSHSDLSFHDDHNQDDNEAASDGDDLDFDDDDDDDDDDNYFDGDVDEYSKLQAQFDYVGLPSGVEVSVPWLTGSNEQLPAAAASSSTFPGLGMQFGSAGAPSGDKDHVSLAKHNEDWAAACTSVSAGYGKHDDNGHDDGVMRKFHEFKRFDMVEDFSDHHFSNANFALQEQLPKGWVKKIQEEWKILEEGLPGTIIYVRVCERRMNLLRAAIVGPLGTPYHDGIFVFDVLFPSNYPCVPPMVYYYSGGLRLNPNLYDCGKVCLSLLNTWNGQSTEMWLPDRSTMLQVLVSIQGLILNKKPFFNEPGHESMFLGDEGERRSKEYNEDVFISSLKTMLYTIRRPPKHFEDFVAGHFRERARDILQACKVYIEGTEVGSVAGEAVAIENGNRRDSGIFRANVGKMMKMLITGFVKNGSHGLEEFKAVAQ